MKWPWTGVCQRLYWDFAGTSYGAYFSSPIEWLWSGLGWESARGPTGTLWGLHTGPTRVAEERRGEERRGEERRGEERRGEERRGEERRGEESRKGRSPAQGRSSWFWGRQKGPEATNWQGPAARRIASHPLLLSPASDSTQRIDSPWARFLPDRWQQGAFDKELLVFHTAPTGAAV